ncbi:MAG: hypothetical protein K0S41_2064 [Anaerocolumna sp.]|jgi:hypothetical protein|nr:hypothetical protein [Anaerocolumna sp.]
MGKNNFESLADNRMEFMNRLAMDDELAKCMLNKADYFKDTTITELEKANLMFKQIYPFQKTTGKLSTDKSYITMRFKYKKLPSGNVYKASYVTLYIFCPDSLFVTKYNQLRTDYMLQCVDRLLNDTRGEGWIGKLALETMDDIVMDNDGEYVGIAVTYKNTEFQ